MHTIKNVFSPLHKNIPTLAKVRQVKNKYYFSSLLLPIFQDLVTHSSLKHNGRREGWAGYWCWLGLRKIVVIDGKRYLHTHLYIRSFPSTSTPSHILHTFIHIKTLILIATATPQDNFHNDDKNLPRKRSRWYR